jgi:hypothetical protein
VCRAAVLSVLDSLRVLESRVFVQPAFEVVVDVDAALGVFAVAIVLEVT